MRIIAAEHVGETRCAVIDGERVLELHVARWSERASRALRGEVFRARVRRIDAALNGAFCDLGRGPEGFLPFGGKGRPDGLHEGAAIGVQIAREAFQQKGPTLALFEVEPGAAPETVIAAPPLAERLAMGFDAAVRSEAEAGVDLEPLFDAALEPEVSLSGGGRLIIEPTAALVAIDVDAGGRKSAAVGARFAMEVNKAAAKEAARQIRLRGLGGVIAIDFLPLKKKGDQSALQAAIQSAFKGDPAKVDIAPPSRFAIVELARQRLGRPLHEIMTERGADTIETAALSALRSLEREGRANRGARLSLEAGADVHGWLEEDPIGWRKAMSSKLGARFETALSNRLPPNGFQTRTLS